MKQIEAFNLLKMGENIFLTGAAGAGKTYLLNQYIRYLKTNNVVVAVTASTGIAATHLQGQTIHAWSGIGVKDELTDEDLDKLIKKSNIKRNYKKTKVLVIDEISMLHAHQLDMVDTIARFMLGNNLPFGGIQVILCGDFFQLPPVSSSFSQKDSTFAFESDIWQNNTFKICYLEEQHRQGDDPLLTVLNDIRSGTAGEHTKVPLRTRYKKEPHGETKATKLYTRNMNVDSMNNQELASIPSQEKIYNMKTSGFPALVEGLKKSCLAQEQLKLKIGAEVIFVKNEPLGKYVNGTRAVVVAFDQSPDAWPVVKTYDNRHIVANAEEWKFADHNGYVMATLLQVPLRLAWAITIHKSQGMTLDAAEIDLGDAFEPGMGYVALSRVRSLSGLKLMNLNEMALKVHPDVLEQDKTFKQQSAEFVDYLNHLSNTEKEELQQKTLIERFDGGEEKAAVQKAAKIKKQNEPPTHIMTLNLLKEGLSVDEVAEKRGFTPTTILGHLEKLQGLHLLDNAYLSSLKDKISKEAFDAIMAELQKSDDGKLKPIWDALGGKYSYENIQLVRLFLR